MIQAPTPRSTITIGGKGSTDSPFQVPPQMKSLTFVTWS
jgi:hypothetical protein